jgi:hypothetical protein
MREGDIVRPVMRPVGDEEIRDPANDAALSPSVTARPAAARRKRLFFTSVKITHFDANFTHRHDP